MSFAVPTPPVVEAVLAELLERWQDAPVLALRCAGWSGPATLEVRGRRCRLRWCPSGLALREALLPANDGGDGAEAGGDVQVLLTDRGDDDLGLDLLARLPRQRVVAIDPWRILAFSFRAKRLDARLAEHAWLAEALLAAKPKEGFAPAASNVLDLDTAWSALLVHGLGLRADGLDLDGLLAWSAGDDAAERLAGLGEAAVAQAVAQMGRHLGEAGATVAELVRRGRANDALPLGLACRALFAPGARRTPDGLKAQGRLEAELGIALAPDAGTRWADAAERVLAGLAGDGRRRALERADGWVERLGIAAFAGASDWLPSGTEAGIEAFAEALEEAARAPERADLAGLERIRGRLAAHRGTDRRRLRSMTMAARLVRWLAGAPDPAATSFPDAACRYAGELAFVDLARHVLFTEDVAVAGDRSGRLTAAYRALLDCAQALRERFNERFGTLVAGYFEAGGEDPRLLPVESVIPRIVAPLAAQRPVLLLVLDGMSFAVFHELIADLLTRGFEPAVPADGAEGVVAGGALVGLATLPSDTRTSRHALLTGRLAPGSQPRERQGFTEHPALAGHGRTPPVLFHKAALRDAGGGLADAARRAVEDPGQRVVGAVINAVDDLLSRGDQVLPRWRAAVVRHLPALLEAASGAGRAVVLVSDHGHVPEHDLAYVRQRGDSARYAATGRPPAAGEVAVRGRRVVMAGDDPLVVTWSERLRHGRRQAGYHGGAAPQEVVVPVATLLPAGVAIDGWHRPTTRLPGWWEARAGDPRARPGAERAPTPARPAKRPTKRAKRPADRAQGALFGEPASLLDALFASEVLAEQAARAGGAAWADPARIRPLLELLERHGGRLSLEASMRSLSLGLPRLRAFVTHVQRLLNVDGYPILDLDEGAGELRLDLDLLAEQLGLGNGA